MESVRAVRKVNAENQSETPINTGRRPIRSASMLNRSEPTSTPTNAALNTGPREAAGIFQSRTRAGAT